MSIFRALRRKSTQPDALFMAMVALAEPALPDVKKLSACLLDHWPGKPRFGVFKRVDPTITCEIGDAIGAVGLIPTPIAAGDIEAACAVSLAWPDAEAALQTHTAHLICCVTGPVEKKVAAFHLTKLVAAISQVTPALGVYWGAANLVHPPQLFFEQAVDMTQEILPLNLWIQFILGKRDGKVTLRTHGMSSLGFLELEIVESEREPNEVGGFAFNAAHYLLDHGPILADGNTFGLSAEEKVPVRRVAAIADAERTVYRLDY